MSLPSKPEFASGDPVTSGLVLPAVGKLQAASSVAAAVAVVSAVAATLDTATDLVGTALP